MDAEASQLAGAGLHERSENRLTYPNGYREREWDTRVGTVDPQIPKLRQGAYFPSLLEPRRRHERALLAVVQEAYVDGVSTRAVDNLVGRAHMGLTALLLSSQDAQRSINSCTRGNVGPIVTGRPTMWTPCAGSSQ